MKLPHVWVFFHPPPSPCLPSLSPEEFGKRNIKYIILRSQIGLTTVNVYSIVLAIGVNYSLGLSGSKEQTTQARCSVVECWGND